MALNNTQKEALEQGFIQVGLSVILYLVYAVVGFISAILIGFIIPSFIVGYIQGLVILLTQGLGGYFAIKALQSDSNSEQQLD